MDCEQARKLIIEFLYDELSSEIVPELQEHLTGCKDCLKYREEIQQTLECLNQVEDLRATVDLAALHDVIERKQHRIRRFLRRGWPAWVAVGVCCLMLSMFTMFVSEIRYEDNTLTIRLNGKETESLAERTARILATYREDQSRFQTQLSDELRASVAVLSQMIDEYETQRDKRIAGAFQQMQMQQHEVLVAIQRELETLASRTEDEFERSWLTMAAMVDLVESQ